MRKLRLRLRNLFEMAQAVSGSLLAEAGPAPPGGPPLSVCGRGMEAQEGTLSYQASFCSGLCSRSSEDRWDVTDTRDLETVVIHLSTGERKALHKGPGHIGLCTNRSPLLGLPRLELELL